MKNIDKTRLTVGQFQKMYIASAAAIMESEGLLTKIDRVIGDGDHGVGMHRGFQAVHYNLTHNEYRCVDDLCYNVSIELIRTMGGASGVIFGTMFMGGLSSLPHESEVSAVPLSDYFMKGENAIEKRGKGHPGQKTMLDALYPACSMMKQYTEAGGMDIEILFEKGAEGARDGAEESKNFLSRKGRSKNFREKTIGLPDPGAVSTSIIFKAFCDTIHICYEV
ncbi:MAG: dihydroxyacetone kinase subunit L [Lachnospiraceae bacterium]|nr:dihydroxyacetone kinase subunit L [Lachnospiraceae bacterium]